MSTSAAAPHGNLDLFRVPKPVVLWALALVGAAASSCAFTLALTSEAVQGDLGEPLVIAFLANWITLSYVLGGLIAWSRRPCEPLPARS